MMPRTSYQQKACDLDGKVGVMGKARSSTLEGAPEGVNALCLR